MQTATNASLQSPVSKNKEKFTEFHLSRRRKAIQDTFAHNNITDATNVKFDMTALKLATGGFSVIQKVRVQSQRGSNHL
jgi:hypothetical protein